MLNRSASLAMSTSVRKNLPGKLDINRHSPSIPYLYGPHGEKICLRSLLLSHVQMQKQTRTLTIKLPKGSGQTARMKQNQVFS